MFINIPQYTIKIGDYKQNAPPKTGGAFLNQRYSSLTKYYLDKV